MDRRFSHSLGLDSGTASIKFLFSSLMLAWCFTKSSLGLSKSFSEQGGKEIVQMGCEGRGKGENINGNVGGREGEMEKIQNWER